MAVSLRRMCLVIALAACGVCCKRSPQYVVVHVLRDPDSSFKANLRLTELDFAAKKHYIASGKLIIIGTLEGGSFPGLLQESSHSPWDLVLFDAESDVPHDLRQELGPETHVCGERPAFIPTAIVNEQREAAQIYLRFITMDCK